MPTLNKNSEKGGNFKYGKNCNYLWRIFAQKQKATKNIII